MAKSRIRRMDAMKECNEDLLECIVDAMCAAVKVGAMSAVAYAAFSMATPLQDSKHNGSLDAVVNQAEALLQYDKNNDGADKIIDYKQNPNYLGQDAEQLENFKWGVSKK